jgi:hypothetical protein
MPRVILSVCSFTRLLFVVLYHIGAFRITGWFKLLDSANGSQRNVPIVPEEVQQEIIATANDAAVDVVMDSLGSFRIVRDPTKARPQQRATPSIPTPTAPVVATPTTPAVVAAPEPPPSRPVASIMREVRQYSTADFEFLKVLGQGSYGKVFLAALHEDDGNLYAVKVLSKANVLYVWCLWA